MDEPEAEEMTLEELMSEAAKLTVPPEKEDNEVTPKSFAMLSGNKLSLRQARRRLDALHEAGLLTKREVYENKHFTHAYASVSGDWKDVIEHLK